MQLLDSAPLPEPETGRFALVKTTLLDYPGRVACAVFLPGCHLKCPFCHNPAFVDPSRGDRISALTDTMNSLQEFLNHRSRRLGGIVFSGGEALLHPLLPSLVKMALNHNLPVKIDSAGLLPRRLKGYLDTGCVDYAAIDLKTSPDRYSELGWPRQNAASKESAEYLLNTTFSLLEESGIDYEIRTTVVPGLVESRDLEKMADLARHAPRWVWQVYQKGDTLNPDWGTLNGADEAELQTIADSFTKADNIIIR